MQALSAARLAVQEAQQTDAPLVATAKFQEAQRKLTEADNALERGDVTRSRRLAEQAAVDARLAIAATDYENARRARMDLESAVLSSTL